MPTYDKSYVLRRPLTDTSNVAAAKAESIYSLLNTWGALFDPSTNVNSRAPSQRSFEVKLHILSLTILPSRLIPSSICSSDE